MNISTNHSLNQTLTYFKININLVTKDNNPNIHQTPITIISLHKINHKLASQIQIDNSLRINHKIIVIRN